MENGDHLLRASRNTLLDMLLESRGTTYPLADLPVSAAVEMVYYNHPAEIKVDYPQPDVKYQVFESGVAISQEISSDQRKQVVLTTDHLIGESHAFTVKATKLYGKDLTKTLYKVINVKVGVNTELEVTADKAQVAFNEKNRLTIKSPQEGAVYRIAYINGDVTEPLSKEVLCDGEEQIAIETLEGLKEDIVLSVTVHDTKTKASGVLDMAVPVKVLPNYQVPAAWMVKNKDDEATFTPAIDYNDKAIVRITDSQKSVVYRLLLKQIDGADLPESENWMSRELRGTDGVLDMPVTGTLTEDLILGIIARKAGCEPEIAPLKAIIIIPVKPKVIKGLSVLENTNPKDKNTYLQLSGAQRGISYQLYQQEDDKPVGEPVFYHRNRGIGETRVGGDWVADHYKIEDGMQNWVDSEFVVDSIDADNTGNITFCAGKIKATTTFYIVAKKSTTGFTEVLPAVTVTIA